MGLDAVCRLHQGCATEGFRLEKDHEGDAVLLTPKDVLALGHRVTTEQDGLELTFRDPIFGEAVLGMATHGHISNVWDVSVSNVLWIVPGRSSALKFLQHAAQEQLVSLAPSEHGSCVNKG